MMAGEGGGGGNTTINTVEIADASREISEPSSSTPIDIDTDTIYSNVRVT